MKNKLFNFYYELILGLFTYLMVVIPKLSTVLLFLFFIISLVGFYKEKLKFTFNISLLLLSLFYVTYFIGVFWTDNSSLAVHSLESKLSFIFFPLVFSFKLVERINLRLPIWGFILGVFSTSLIGYFSAINCYSSSFENSCFYSSSISVVHHPSYFSIYILFSLLLIWKGYLKGWKYFSLKWIIPFSLYLLIFYFFCQSLAGILFLIFVLLFILIRSFYKKIGRNISFIILIISPFLLYSLLSNFPVYKVEFNSTIKSFTTFISNPKGYVDEKVGYKTGNEERMVLWVTTYSLIKKHPFGVGTGNVDDYLYLELLKLRQGGLALKNYNPHNQYLQTTLEIGFIGLLILLVFVFLVLYKAIRESNWILILLISSLIFNSFFESILQRQSGIVFFSFWICLFLVYPFSLNSYKEGISKEK